MAKFLDIFGVMDSFYTDKLVAETNPYSPYVQRCEVHTSLSVLCTLLWVGSSVP